VSTLPRQFVRHATPGSRRSAARIAVIMLGLLAVVPRPARAEVFQCAAGDVACVISAIRVANENGEKNTIRLASGTYSLLAIDNDTNGPNGLPSITSTLRIQGAGAATTVLTSSVKLRLIHVGSSGRLTLTGITLTGGGGPLNLPVIGGAGLFNNGGVVKVTDSVVSSNFGGAISNNGGDIEIARSVVSGNLNDRGDLRQGGGLYNNRGTVTISQSTFANNVAGSGGGLYTTGGAVSIHESRFTTNDAEFDAGGVVATGGTVVVVTQSTFDHNGSQFAGGLSIDLGTLVMANSSLVENGGKGAAIGVLSGSTALVTNTTVARNQLIHEAFALFNQGTLILVNDTVADNTGPGVGGVLGTASGLLTSTGGNAMTLLVNTIVANNAQELLFGGGAVPSNCIGPVSSLGNNLFSDITGCAVTLQPSDRIADAGLDTFQDHGPGRAYYPLLPTSAAIDAGNNAVCPRTDQIGRRRVGRCDIGAIAFRDGDDRHHGRDEEDFGVAPFERVDRMAAAVDAINALAASHDVVGILHQIRRLLTR